MNLYVDRPPSCEFYRCRHCRKQLPFRNRKDIDFLFCPYCSKSLVIDEKETNTETGSSNKNE